LRIVFDKNVPIGIRHFLSRHELRTFVEMNWRPQLENGELLKVAEASGFDVMVTADQDIRHQQNLAGRKLSLVVLGSSIWPVVRNHGALVSNRVDAAIPGSYEFIEMPLPPRRPRDGG
jgi:hypothetical protein